MIAEAALLRSLGHEVFVSGPYFDGFNLGSSQMSAIGARVVSFDPPNFVEEWRWRHLRKFLSIGNGIYLKQLRIDFATIFSYDMTFCGSRAYILNKCGIPWVITIPGTCFQYFRGPWTEKLLRNAFLSMLGGYTVLKLFVKVPLDMPVILYTIRKRSMSLQMVWMSLTLGRTRLIVLRFANRLVSGRRFCRGFFRTAGF